MALIDVQGVTKRYTGHTALDNVSLSIERGRVFGLLGPNGAGKTSLIRLINYITRPDEGQILFDGKPLGEQDVARIGYLPEERGLYRKMEVGEQAVYLARLKGLDKREAKRRLELWFEKFDIMPWWHKRVEELSKGMQQKVQFVCTVLHEPELLIFDEPFSGFDPVNAELLKREILELKNKGATLIFSTHNMQSVEEICDDIALIDRSKLMLFGQIDQIREGHGTSRYTLHLRGHITPEELAVVGRPMSLSHEGTDSKLSIFLEPEEPRNLRALLSTLPEHIEVLSAQYELPTMHEIFLNTVNHHGE